MNLLKFIVYYHNIVKWIFDEDLGMLSINYSCVYCKKFYNLLIFYTTEQVCSKLPIFVLFCTK